MMKKLLLALLLSSSVAQAQFATTTTTAPIGDNTNRIASTGFVNGGGLGFGVVGNSNLAQMPAFTFKGNNTAVGAPPIDLTVAQTKSLLTVSVSVTDSAFGAKCDGTTDDTTAIQATINSLPANGGIVLFPVANCKISSTLTIGNGTTSAVSTRSGVILQGIANPGTGSAVFPFTTVTGPKLTWVGGASPMISIKGPLSGWGIQNLYLDGASTATQCIAPTSAQNGDSRNLVIVNCLQGIGSTSNPIGGYTGVNNVDSWQNIWTNTTVVVPGAAGNFGIVLTGASDGTSDTDYNVFVGTTILVGGTNMAVSFQVSDGNIFNNLRVIKSGGTPGAILYDYTVNSGFPSGNIINSVDTGAPTLTFVNNGTPGAGAKANIVNGLQEQNGSTAPSVVNLAVYGAHNINLSQGGNNPSTQISTTNGHLGYSGTAPTLTAGCNGAGSAGVTGTDNAGLINGQTAAATTCTVTFAKTYTTAPFCTANGVNGAVTLLSTTTTALVIVFPSTAGWFGSFICVGI
ncbi:MAG TPA: hypothetical protein VGA05_08330 [Candidatus Bathyarchaeia archaeon]